MELKILDKNGKAGKAATVADAIFAAPVKANLIHEAVLCHQANLRTGNACTKNRKLVSGGGKKPWKQKGTGRARSGSSRSPLWVGGGTTFGPQPRGYSYSLPKKISRGALVSAFSAKVADGSFKMVDDLDVAAPKTRLMMETLASLGCTGSLLIIVDKKTRNQVLAARNLPDVKLISAENINAYDLILFKTVLATKAAVARIEEVLG